MSSLQWLVNDGGPLLVLPREVLPFWEGSEPPSGNRAVEVRSRWGYKIATDYDRACDVQEWIAAIDVGPGRGIVLGGDQTNAAWLRPPQSDAFLIVRLIYANDTSEAKILGLYEGRRDEDWVRLGSTLDAEHGELLLFHAASVGLEVEEKLGSSGEVIVIGDAIPYHAGSGSYTVDTCEVVLPEEGHYIFHRFVRGAATAT